MKWVVLGAKGMLGEEIVEYLRENDRNFLGYAHSDIEITNRKDLEGIINDKKPDIVVNAAAYTDVDGAEEQTEEALRVNGKALKILAQLTREASFQLVHISTDYVFGGKKQTPYTESDTPEPLNSYGISKLAGELFLKAYGRNWMLVRSSGLYGGNPEIHSNFVSAILNNLQRKTTTDVVEDQVTCPTWTRPLVEKIIQLVERNYEGLVHLTSSGSCSWFEFATILAEHLGDTDSIRPVTSEEFASRASRPKYSVLKTERIESKERVLPHWKKMLKQYLQEKNL